MTRTPNHERRTYRRAILTVIGIAVLAAVIAAGVKGCGG